MTTYDLKMKKTIPSKEVLEQYIYDYGIDKTAQIFHISTEELDKKINWKPQYDQYSYNPAIAKPLSSQHKQIMAIIAKHYPDLLKQCADNYKDVIYMSQTVEDLLHKAIIKCLEIGLDKCLRVSGKHNDLESVKIQFNTARKYVQLQSYTMNKKILPLEIATESGEYIIPTEYYNNALFKESEETA